MRPKIVALVIGIAVVAVMGLFFLRARQPGPNDGAAGSADLARKTAQTPGGPQGQASNSITSPVAQNLDGRPDVRTTNFLTGTSAAGGLTREDYIEKRVGELTDLAMTDDPEALKTILSEINNPEGEIRKAAIEASKQFGSADAIPKLEEALASADGADKQDIKEAIEFLKLPSFLAKRN
jgi:hypothetical protein